MNTPISQELPTEAAWGEAVRIEECPLISRIELINVDLTVGSTTAAPSLEQQRHNDTNALKRVKSVKWPEGVKIRMNESILRHNSSFMGRERSSSPNFRRSFSGFYVPFGDDDQRFIRRTSLSRSIHRVPSRLPFASQSSEGSSITVCCINVICNTIGAGVLSLPFAVEKGSIIISGLLLLICGALSAFTCYILAYAAETVQKYSFTEIVAFTIFPDQDLGFMFNTSINSTVAPTSRLLVSQDNYNIHKDKTHGDNDVEKFSCVKSLASAAITGVRGSLPDPHSIPALIHQPLTFFTPLTTTMSVMDRPEYDEDEGIHDPLYESLQHKRRRYTTMFLEGIIVLQAICTVVIYAKVIANSMPNVMSHMLSPFVSVDVDFDNKNVTLSTSSWSHSTQGKIVNTFIKILMSHTFWLMAPAVGFFLLTCIRKMADLVWTSVIGVVTIFYIVVLVVLRYYSDFGGSPSPLGPFEPTTVPVTNVTNMTMTLVKKVAGAFTSKNIGLWLSPPSAKNLVITPSPSRGDIEWFHLSAFSFSTIATFTTAYATQSNVPYFYEEMKDRRPRSFATVMSITMPFVIVCYALTGFFGYLTFGGAVADPEIAGNIVNNYSDEDRLMNIGRLGLFFHFTFVYPLLAISARRGLHRLICMMFEKPIQLSTDGQDDHDIAEAGETQKLLSFHPPGSPATTTRRIIILEAFFIIFTATLIAAFVPNIGIMVELTGALFGIPMSFILPGLVGTRVFRQDIEVQELRFPIRCYWFLSYVTVMLAAVSFACSVVAFGLERYGELWK